MKFDVVSQLDKRKYLDALIIPFWQVKKGRGKLEAKPEALLACDAGLPNIGSLKELVVPILASGDFTGEKGSVSLSYARSPCEPRILCVGLGDAQSITLETLRRSFSKAVSMLSSLQSESCTVVLPSIDILQETVVAQAIAEGMLLANYKFLQGKKETKNDKGNSIIASVQFVGSEPKAIKSALDTVTVTAKGVFLARDLVNGNADDITPKHIAHVAKELVKRHARLSCTVHDKKWIEKKGMGLFLAVAQASRHEPAFIVVRYRGNPTSKDHTVIVGKSVTFDTGGLNMKPTGGIEMQRCDMAGAAAVLGTLSAVSGLDLPINVTGVIAACENAVGPLSYKPGDVFTSYLGKTVEVNNTDAEGRLTLADALAYAAKELNPSRIIDLATLTGSCIVALGTEVAALLSNSDMLSGDLMAASHRTHERIWPLPLYDDYRERLRSDIADMKNTAGREGGAILGGAFLKDFVGDVVWAHLDIAGVAYLNEAKDYLPKYGTGFGVRLLVDFLLNLCKKDR